MKTTIHESAGNPVAAVPDQRSRSNRPQPKQRFKILPFTNAGGSHAWRVSGITRTGRRIRENYNDADSARCRQTELEAEFLARTGEPTTLRSTRLSETQARIAEAAFPMLERDDDLLVAVHFWKEHKSKFVSTESPRLDEAVKKFMEWLDGAKDSTGNGVCTLREHSRNGLRIRVKIFGNGIRNQRVDEIGTETVESFLGKLNVSQVTRDNYKRDISRFFSWCIERPRRWTTNNPCSVITIDRGEKKPPVILTLRQAENLLHAAEQQSIAPYVAVCLFGGLRPFEASRLTWDAINLEDKEIRLEANQTKTGRARVVVISDTLLKWLKTYKGTPLFPSGWRTKFDAVKEAAGFGTTTDGKLDLRPWVPDIMRHTAISHYFRKCGSYGQTAEQFGNSEQIIKAHYQGRVSTTDTKKFYNIKPKAGK